MTNTGSNGAAAPRFGTDAQHEQNRLDWYRAASGPTGGPKDVAPTRPEINR